MNLCSFIAVPLFANFLRKYPRFIELMLIFFLLFAKYSFFCLFVCRFVRESFFLIHRAGVCVSDRFFLISQRLRNHIKLIELILWIKQAKKTTNENPENIYPHNDNQIQI